MNKAMRKFRVRWSLMLLFALAHPAFAAFRPSFKLDDSSWHSTYVVLVMTTPADGAFEVVESWKGDLSLGERLAIPELRPAPDAIPISRDPKSWSEAVRGGVSELVPRVPVGSRMVLFLSRTDETLGANGTDKVGAQGWKPSDLMDTLNASVLWIDGYQLYCFTQLLNPGPSVLFALPDSETKVRNRVAEIKQIQENMTVALAITDRAERAERPKPYVRSDVFPAQLFALAELGKSGSHAVRTILEMLDDPSFADQSPELVKALTQAGGESVGAELNSRLRADLAFWRSKGSSLSQGWWNEDARIHAPLRERYDHTYQLVVGLEKTQYTGALNTATQLRDLWRSLPQLNDPQGLNELAKECDKLIRHLQTN